MSGQTQVILNVEIIRKFLGGGFEARGSKDFAEIKIEGCYRATDMGRI
jgi:hypothetical protein